MLALHEKEGKMLLTSINFSSDDHRSATNLCSADTAILSIIIDDFIFTSFDLFSCRFSPWLAQKRQCFEFVACPSGHHQSNRRTGQNLPQYMAMSCGGPRFREKRAFCASFDAALYAWFSSIYLVHGVISLSCAVGVLW